MTEFHLVKLEAIEQIIADAAAASAAITAPDAIATAADRVQTGLDAAATAADAIATAADRVQTGLDVAGTNADAIATAADRVQTGLDAAATAADAIATAADRVQTGLDVAAVEGLIAALPTVSVGAKAKDASGSPGDISFGGIYIYHCYSTNAWGRAVMETNYTL